jgi:hypothetical protein
MQGVSSQDVLSACIVALHEPCEGVVSRGRGDLVDHVEEWDRA